MNIILTTHQKGAATEGSLGTKNPPLCFTTLHFSPLLMLFYTKKLDFTSKIKQVFLTASYKKALHNSL